MNFTPHPEQRLTLIFVSDSFGMTGQMELKLTRQMPDGRWAYKQRNKRKEYYFPALKRDMLLFQGWDLPVKSQGHEKHDIGGGLMSYTLSGNACLNLEGMEPQAMRQFIEANNLNPDTDKAIIIHHKQGTETLLYPELETSHRIINDLKRKQGIEAPPPPAPIPSTPQQTREEIEAALPYFTGSEQFFSLRPALNALLTEGTKYLADAAGAFWLMTDLGATATVKLKHQPFLSAILKLEEPQGNRQPATVTITDGNENVLHVQKYEDTDFPLPEAHLYIADNEEGGRTLMLTSEY